MFYSSNRLFGLFGSNKLCADGRRMESVVARVGASRHCCRRRTNSSSESLIIIVFHSYFFAHSSSTVVGIFWFSHQIVGSQRHAIVGKLRRRFVVEKQIHATRRQTRPISFVCRFGENKHSSVFLTVCFFFLSLTRFLQRFYANTFLDSARQLAIDAVLGTDHDVSTDEADAAFAAAMRKQVRRCFVGFGDC